MIVPKKKSKIDIATVKCQKCLEYGHYNYECKNKRKIVIRDSRTKILNKNLTSKPNEKSANSNKEDSEAPLKKKSKKMPSDSSSSSSSSSDSESDSDSSSQSGSDSKSSSSSSDSN